MATVNIYDIFMYNSIHTVSTIKFVISHILYWHYSYFMSQYKQNIIYNLTILLHASINNNLGLFGIFGFCRKTAVSAGT